MSFQTICTITKCENIAVKSSYPAICGDHAEMKMDHFFDPQKVRSWAREEAERFGGKEDVTDMAECAACGSFADSSCTRPECSIESSLQ